MKRRRQQGVLALHVALRRAKRQGDADLAAKIEAVLADPDMLAMAGAMLEDESGETLLEKILRWIVEHPEEFKAIIEWIFSFFAGLESLLASLFSEF